MNAGATVSSVGHMYEGPADGDYVRYVDQLLARNAAHAVVHAVASQTLPSRPRQPASTAKAAQAAVQSHGAEALLERIRQLQESRADKASSSAGRTATTATQKEKAGAALLGKVESAANPAIGFFKGLGWLAAIALGIAVPPIGIMMLIHGAKKAYDNNAKK